MDKRDKPTWVVVEVNGLAESKIYEERFIPTIKKALKIENDEDIFTPWELVKNSRTIELVAVMEGYFFIRSGLEEHLYFNLERLPFVESVLCTRNGNSMRTIQVVGDDNVNELKQKLKEMLTFDLKAGERVLVGEGNLKNLEGEVIDVLENDLALIYFEFRSLRLATSIPKYFLKRLENNEDEEA